MPDYCETLVRKRDYDRYISALFAPERLRAHLFALYAFNYEIARIAETVRTPLAGQLRLQWWREAVDEIYSGARGRTEVLRALSRAVAVHRLPKESFDAMLDAREQDFESIPFADMAALETYADATSGMLMRLAGCVLGAGDALDEQARGAGTAYAVCGLLRAVPFQVARGRIIVPAQEMQNVGVEAAGILRGHISEPISRLLARVAEVARRHYSSVHRVRRKFLPAILPASLVPRFLQLMTCPGFDPFRDRTEISAHHRYWTMLLAMAHGRI